MLQPPGADCVECGAEIGWIEVEGDLLRWRPKSGSGQGHWVPFAATTTVLTSIGAFLAGGFVSLWVPLIYFTGLSGVGAVGAFVTRKRKAITAVPMPEHAAPEHARAWTGVARSLAGKSLTSSTGSPALVEHLALCDKRGALLLRRIRAVPFVLELDGGDKLVVAGEVRIVGGDAAGDPVGAGDPRLAHMGVPPELVKKKARLAMRVVTAGDRIAVQGLSSQELVAELAFHRDGGQVEVVRGRRGALVLIRSSDMTTGAA